MENTAALLEELGIRSKAVYLPSSLRGGRPQALIPLAEEREIQTARGQIPGRLIVRYGINPDDMAIVVTTFGSITIDMLEVKPGSLPSEIEAAATYILTGMLDIAKSVTVSLANNQLDIEIDGARLYYEDNWYHRCLGSPIASIVAAISSEALQQPVRIRKENFSKERGWIILEVLS